MAAEVSRVEGPGEGRPQVVNSDPVVTAAAGSQANRAAPKYPKTKKVNGEWERMGKGILPCNDKKIILLHIAPIMWHVALVCLLAFMANVY